LTQDPVQSQPPARLPTWALFLAPVIAVVVSNADVLLLARANPQIADEQLRLALLSTIPLSAVACGLTVWYMRRLSKEIDRRDASEFELRMALHQRSVAMDELSESLHRERLLRRELDHRVRNNLAALLGLVGVYEEARTPPADAVEALRGKIIALREVYTLISAAGETGTDLAAVIRSVASGVVDASDAERIELCGPRVDLSGREANALAMIVQELLTNAAKHGALGLGGSIRATWNAAPDSSGTHLEFVWLESFAPEHAPDHVIVAPKHSTGIGLTLVEGFATSDLRGQVRFTPGPASWKVEISAHLRLPSPATGTGLSAQSESIPQPTHKEVCA